MEEQREVGYETGILEVPDNFPMAGEVGLAPWKWWSANTSPFVDLKWDLLSDKPRRAITARYADWLTKPDASCEPEVNIRGPGIYIWLLPRPSGHGWRFVHIGISSRSMKERTYDHCLNQFRKGNGRDEYCMTDRIHCVPLESLGFGSLGTPLWNGKVDGRRSTSPRELQTRYQAALEFLRASRVVYMSRPGITESTLLCMEAVVARSAAELLNSQPWDLNLSSETTNTMNQKMKGIVLTDEDLAVVARTLNEMLEMLPVEREVLTYDQAKSQRV